MARYIDADKIPYFLDTSDEAPMEGRKIAFKSDIDKMPTADVAPKREIALEIIDKIQRPLTMYKRPIFSYDLILQEMIKAIGAVIEEYTEGKV